MKSFALNIRIVLLLFGFALFYTQAADKDVLEKQSNIEREQTAGKNEPIAALGPVSEFIPKPENTLAKTPVFVEQEPTQHGYEQHKQPADGIRFAKESPLRKIKKNNIKITTGIISDKNAYHKETDEALIEAVLNKHISETPLSTAETEILRANINKLPVKTAGERRPSISGHGRLTRDATDLFFSEYGEGSSNNKYLEIYNGTGADVDLSNYLIMQITNGGNWYENIDTLSGTLANGDVYIIAYPSADAGILAEADLVEDAISDFNGDDARALIKVVGSDTTILDKIGSSGSDPGAGWDVAGVTDATKDHTLVRKSSITSGNTSWIASAGTNTTDSEWIVYDENTWSYIGSHTMTEPNLLSEGFEGGEIPENWTVFNNDGNTNSWNAWSSSWYAHTGDYSARVSSYNPQGSDDWLITPKLDVVSGDSIVFWAKSYSGGIPEDFNVKVSTTDNANATAFDGTLASVTSAPNTWTRYVYALDSYADQNIYIAFQCVTVNGYYLYADDFSGPQVWIDDSPVASLNTSSIDFGNTGMGGISAPIVISNFGATDLVISSIAVANSDFSVSSFAATLTGGGSDTEIITVTYTPTVVEEDTSYVVLTHNGSSSPDSVKVMGAGKDAIYWQDFESWGAELFTAEPQPLGMTQEGNMSYSGDGAANGWEKTTGVSIVFAGEYAAEFDSYEGSSGGTDTSAFITPAIEYISTNIGAVEGALRFYMKKRGTEEFYVAYSSDSGTTWTKEYSDTTENYGSGSSGWKSISIEVPLGGTYIFKMVGRANHQSVLGDVFVDEISFVEVPPTPELSLTYSAVGFMPQVIADSTISTAFTVGFNSGSAALVVDSIVTDNEDFSVMLTTMSSGNSVAPGGNVDLDLVWSPTSFGLTKTNAVVYHNADTSPDTIVFSGEAGRSYVSFDDNDDFQGAAFDGDLPWLWVNEDADGDGDSWLFNYSYSGPGYTGDPVGYYARSPGGGNILQTRILLPVTGDSLIFYYNSSNSVDSGYLHIQVNDLGIDDQYSHLDSVRFLGYTNLRAAIDLSAYAGDLIRFRIEDDATYNDYNYHRLDDLLLPAYDISSTGQLVLGEEAIDFGTIHPTTSASVTVAVANMGAADLTISSVVSDNATFSATLANSTVESETSTELTVTFAPTAGGSQTGSIIFLYDAPFSPDTLDLSGAGYSPAGGPDDFGYTWSNNFSASGPSFSWVDTSGATSTGVAIGDDARGTVSLPFPFRFYGIYYNEITVSTNGWVGMGQHTNYGSSYYSNMPIPSTADPNNIIAVMWDDWKAGGSNYGGDILTKTVGTAPNRQFVIIFHNLMRSIDDTDYYSFEALLDETSGDINMQYLDVIGSSSNANNGIGATVGIENADGGEGLMVSYGNGSMASHSMVDSMAIKFVSPPVPDTYITGVVADNETGQALDSVTVNVGGNITYTSSGGEYGYYGALTGLISVEFFKEGYNGAVFGSELLVGDTVTLNAALEPLNLHSLYLSGFESGDDQGSSDAVIGTNSFAVLDTFITVAGDTILPASGLAMLAFPDSGGYADNDYIWWTADSTFEITGSTGGLYFNLDMNIDTEDGYDFFYFCLLLDNGTAWYDSDNGFASGSTGVWTQHSIDMSWVLDMGSETATPVIIFDADVAETGSGGAFDNISVNWNPFFLAPPGQLSAVNYGSTIPLSWEEPAGSGRVSYDVGSIDISMSPPSRPGIIDDNGNTVEQIKGPRDFPIITVYHDYSASSTRSLLGYNVYRAVWPFGDVQLLAHETGNVYDDALVADGSYYQYAVSAVYDEGETGISGLVSARAGLPVVVTDDAYGGEDFEASDFGWENWEAFYSSDAAVWVVGDSTSADSAFGLGGIPAPSHSRFAYLSDGRGNEADFESFLLSPFIDFIDNYTAIVNLSGYAQVYGDFADNNIVRLLVRSDMGPWEVAVDFGYDHMDGWDDYSASIGDIVSGRDKVQLALHYTHTGGLNSGNGNGVAFDDLVFETIPGPHSLSLAPTTTNITLSWSHPDSTSFAATRSLQPAQSSNVAMDTDGIIDFSTNRELTCFNPNQMLYYWWGMVPGSGIWSITEFEADTVPLLSVTVDYRNTPFTINTNLEAEVMVAVIDTLDSLVATMDTIYHGYQNIPTGAAEGNEAFTVALNDTFYNAPDKAVFVMIRGRTSAVWNIDGTDTTYYNAPFFRSDDGASWSGMSGQVDSLGGMYVIGGDAFGLPDWVDFSIELCADVPPPDMSYNIYKDRMLVAERLEENMWVDENVTATIESCYRVHGVVPRYFNVGPEVLYVLHETDPSNEECASAVNSPPGNFSLTTPPDGHVVVIRPENIDQSQLFAWTISVDPNGQPVNYTITLNATISGSVVTIEQDTSARVVMIPYNDVYNILSDYDIQDTVGFHWTVSASDGQLSTTASNGPRTIVFDIGYMLSNDSELLLPDVYALHQNYPNPFNPITTIRYDIPEESHVRIDVYNVLGQKVAKLVETFHQPGFHTVNWDGTNMLGSALSSGMYFYRIQARDFTAVKKLLLVK